jgi:copper chaperone
VVTLPAYGLPLGSRSRGLPASLDLALWVKVYSTLMEVLTMKVTGMHCESCANALSASLRVLPGVHRVESHADSGKTVVTYDPQKAEPAAIRRQVEIAGFDVVGD